MENLLLEEPTASDASIETGYVDYARNAPEGWENIEAGEELTETPAAEPEPPVAEPPTSKVALSFTVVHGYLRGEHRCPFELHATGCRDLKKALRHGMYHYEVLAGDQAAAIAAATAEHGAGNVWTQPCTLLKRMQAIGRA